MSLFEDFGEFFRGLWRVLSRTLEASGSRDKQARKTRGSLSFSLSPFSVGTKNPIFFISFRKVVVVDDDQINACALPGGKIVINSGLVKRFQHDEAALAFVIAHEVGHVLARHSAEQLTLQGATQLVATVAQGVAMAAAAAAAASGQPGVPMPRGERRERRFFFALFCTFGN